MKKEYKDNRHSVKGLLFKTALLILPVIHILLLLMLPRMVLSRAAADFYSSRIFPVIAFPLDSLSNLFYVSLTENIIVVGSIFLLILLVFGIVSGIKTVRRKGWRPFFTSLIKVVAVLLILADTGVRIFQLMHGLNYLRTPAAGRMVTETMDHTYEDYEDTLTWAYQGMIAARYELGEDYLGVAHMQSSFPDCVDDANLLINSVSYYYDLDMSVNYVRSKPVALSRIWGYTHIAGAYDPLLGETNIKTDYIDVLHFPVTLCHEIAHAKGYARESDANTIAVISCILSDRADFRYAGYYYIFINLYGTVRDYAEHEGRELPEYTSYPAFEMVRRDMIAFNDNYHIYETGVIADLIAEFSEDANNAFLEANGQEGGTDTYVVPSNFYVDYFCERIQVTDNEDNP
ncbi:MAG TPA: hypothetical protein DCW41_04755 [Clostridiales bacterium]|nr:hypothetical protein [Clostridiales bacterium]